MSIYFISKTRIHSSRMRTARLMTVCLLVHTSERGEDGSTPRYSPPPYSAPQYLPPYSPSPRIHPPLYSPPHIHPLSIFTPHIHPMHIHPLYIHPPPYSLPPYSMGQVSHCIAGPAPLHCGMDEPPVDRMTGTCENSTSPYFVCGR